MNKYKTFEELKEELGNNYDLFMYEINLCLLQKIDKAIEYIENTKVLGDDLKTFKIGKDLLSIILNDEVDNQDKKIEKLSFGDVSGTPKRANENDIIDKINEIIDKLNGDKEMEIKKMSEDIKDFLTTLEEYANGFDNIIAPHEDTIKDFLSYFNELQAKNKNQEKMLRKIFNVVYDNISLLKQQEIIRAVLLGEDDEIYWEFDEILGDKENEDIK